MVKNQSKRIVTKRNLIFLTPFILALLVFTVQASAAQVGTAETAQKETPGLGLVAAGLAVGLSGIGAGIAIFGSTSAGMAATVERPELTTWVLIFAGLGEGLAIYGLVVAIMILGKI